MVLDISKLGRKSFISQAAVAEILTAVRDSGELPQATSKATVKRRRDNGISVDTPYGPLVHMKTLVSKDGSALDVPFANPAAWLYHTSRNCPRMMSLFNSASKHANHINQPWRLMLYCDEVSPGNQLKVHNRRKLQCVYYSVQEFGGYELTQEYAWSVLTCIRTDLVNKLQDWMSQFFRHCVNCFSMANANMATGISIQVAGEARFCCFKLGYILADEAALKQIFENKGASGKMLCMFCQTTVNKRYAPSNMDRYVLHTTVDPSVLCLHSDTSVWQIVDHLATQSGAGLTKKQFSDLEMNLGFNHCPEGLLQDVAMRSLVKPITYTCFDPMHVFLVSGVWHREVTLLLGRLADDGFRQNMLHAWVMSFIWPDIHGGASCSARLVFKKKKESDSEFKCTSSEALAVYPVVRSFLHHHVQRPSNALYLAMKSYYDLCEVLDSLKLAATGSLQPSVFQRQIETYLTSFVATCLHLHHMLLLCLLHFPNHV